MKLATLRILAILAIFISILIGTTHGACAGIVSGVFMGAGLAQMAQNPYCLGLKVVPLPRDTAAGTGFTHLIILTFDDLTEVTANTAQTIALLAVQAGDAVLRAATLLKTAFTDASDAAFNTTAAVIGDGGDTDRFIASQELNSNGTEVFYKVHPSTTPFVYTAADTIDIVVSAMAAKALNDIDAGELHVYLGIARLEALSANAGSALDYSS